MEKSTSCEEIVPIRHEVINVEGSLSQQCSAEEIQVLPIESDDRDEDAKANHSRNRPFLNETTNHQLLGKKRHWDHDNNT
jgi:hypothetical protein